MSPDVVGINVRCYRQLLGLSQWGLIGRTGSFLSQSGLSRLETGRWGTHSSAVKLRRIIPPLAAALGVSQRDLVRRQRRVTLKSFRPVVLEVVH